MIIKTIFDNAFDASFILIVGLVLLFSIACVIFLILFIKFIIKSMTSAGKNGNKVLATIKSIERENRRDRDSYIRHVDYVIMCAFNYNGEEHTEKLFYNYKTNPNKLKIGDQIECIYDKKRKYLTTKENVKGMGLTLLIFLGFGLIFFAAYFIPEKVIKANIFGLSENTISMLTFGGNLFMLIVVFIIWEYIAIRMYDRYYQEGKYIKLKGRVVDIHAKVDTTSDIYVDIYAPEIVFKYNEKKERFISSRWSTRVKYKSGQEVDVYYNPETNTIYEKGNNTLAIGMIILGLLFIIPIVQMFI